MSFNSYAFLCVVSYFFIEKLDNVGDGKKCCCYCCRFSFVDYVIKIAGEVYASFLFAQVIGKQDCVFGIFGVVAAEVLLVLLNKLGYVSVAYYHKELNVNHFYFYI